MSGPIAVIVFCDVCDFAATERTVASLPAASTYAVKVVPLTNGPTLARSVRTVLGGQRVGGTPFCVANWCAGNSESVDRADASAVANLLQNTHEAPIIGNPLMITRYDMEDIRKIMFYSELTCNMFCVVKCPKDFPQLTAVPRPSNVVAGDEVVAANLIDAEAVEAAVAKALAEHPVVIVTESAVEGTACSMVLLVSGGAVYNTPTLRSIDGGSVPTVSEDALSAFVSTVVSSIMGVSGHAKVFVRVGADGALVLTNVVFNIAAPVEEAGLTFADYLAKEVPSVLARAEKLAPRHIVSFDTVGKGYFMRAAMDIRKGELVFEDERRAFALVTREHVAKTWSDLDKYTFSRYAWPIDADCHVYAIWEDEPKRWRPINHSCDPNLVFAEGHSLNVIARRDIKEREDLTLDYSTFCDYTMKPFECFCKSDLCRGTVIPGQVPWEQYGTHSWLRREPPQVSELIPDGAAH